MQLKTKKNSIIKIAVFVIAMLVLCSVLIGSSLAWFTDKQELTGSGNLPIVCATLTQENVTKNTEITISSVTESSYSKNVKVSLSDTTIDVLLRVRIVANWYDDTDMISNTDDWCTFDISTTNWIKSGDWYYLSKKVAKADVSTPISVFSTITINSTTATGKDLKIYVYAEAAQANDFGIELLKGSSNEYTLPSTYTSKAILN
jgi:predicted ribosomally synthesized peptide with SipW-like signal peptide